ncbi:MAG: S8 family serine peptidase [Bacteroidales bacterium]
MKKKKATQILLLALAVISLGLSPAGAQKKADYQLHFKNLQYEPAPNLQHFVENFTTREQSLFDGQFYKIIQFYEIPDEQAKSQLKAAGITLLDYIPQRAYFAAISADFDAGVLSRSQVRSIVDVDRSIKLAPMLFEESYPDYALRGDGKIELLVNYYPGIEPEAAVKILTEKGFEVVYREDFGRYAHVISSLEDIDRLAGQELVVYVEPVYPFPVPDNYTGRTLHRSNAIANDFTLGRHYDGTGVSVMLQDDGKIGPHVDYEGRLIQQYINYNYGDHGDHCAGIIMAAGNIDPKARGNAFGADLYVYGAAPTYPGFNAIPSHYFSNEIRVTSTSYSNGCNAGYTSLTRTMDQQIRIYPALMHVFSAGNAGGDNCGYGAGPGWGNITGGHKAGKNVMTVANLDYLDDLSGSSSRGPAHDGRIKPDISAKGSDVNSTIDPNTYGLKSGTSMSCPGVAGVMTQLFHAYREMNGSDAMGGLLKAIALNTAEDLGNPGPDFKYGWGRINGLRAVEVMEEGRYDSATIAQGETFNHEFEVPENTAQMRVMIYWTDYEASVNTNWALVNDLDITVTDPASEMWYPWVLNHYPNTDSLDKDAIRGIDNRNNVEQVTMEYPEAGTYTLTVDGTLVPQGPQKYYIIYEFIPDEVIVTYPYGGEKLAPGSDELIRWDAYGTEGSFDIEVSLDDGQTWQTVKEDLPGNQRYYNWVVPTAVTGQAWIRVIRDESVGMSVAPFSIIPVPGNLTIDWACDEALHLSWNEVFGATSYTVYMLGEKYMEPIGITTVNSFIVEDITSGGNYWFSVSANGPDGAEGQRAFAIEKTPGTFDCNEVDAMLVSVPSVEWGTFQACLEVSSLNVTVEMKNFGLEAIVNPEFHYQLDGGEVLTETYNGFIFPDSTISFTFADPIDVSTIGSYNLQVWVEYGPDQNPDNDMIETQIEVIEGTTMTPGNIQVVDNFELCLPAPLCELYSCELDNGWINLTNEVQDDIDWRTWHGTTYSFGTGPSFDHTTGTSTGRYLYLEPSVGCYYKEAILTAPCIDLTAGVSPAFTFWYHAYGSDIGHLHVDLFDGSQIIRDITAPIVGNHGDEWKEVTVDLSPWNGQVIGIRIRAYTGGGEKGDIAIDDIGVTDVTAVEEPLANGEINIYPNPSNGHFNISVSDAGTQDYDLRVIDLYGRVVYQGTAASASGRINQSVGLSHLAKGVYFLQLKSADRTYQSKISIE